EIEAVHGARDVEIAVGVEDIHEALSERFEVALNRELGRERVAALPHVFADRLAPEALRPFGGGTIGDGAELARQALPRARRRTVSKPARAMSSTDRSGNVSR